MPKYFYLAKSLSGEEKTGILEAKDLHQLSQILHEQGFVLVKAVLEKEEMKKRFFSLPSFRISLAEKMFFTRNLQVMVSAGLSIPRALEILAAQTKNRKFSKIISEIKEEIVKGKSFSEALSSYSNVFSEFFQNMIKVGEETGSLEDVLKILASQMEKEKDIKSRVTGAMIYPAVIIMAMIGIGALMLILVIPKLAETFKELEVELPLTTRFVINLAEFLLKKWYFIIFFLFVFIFVLRFFLKTSFGKKSFDYLLLKIPIISPIIKETNTAYTARNLSSLISAGISLPKALEITANTLGNIFYKEALRETAEKIRKGEKMSQALKPYENIYPLTLIQMISVGEETGETSTILVKLAEFYEEEVSNKTKNLASVVEPLLMLIIGGVIGFFAISMVQPMYSMLQAFK